MKIIHCADLHLDSKLNTHLDNAKAKERSAELLSTYLRMVDYAKDNGVSAILIAGDMFDTKNVKVGTKNAVMKSIDENPEISFFYLKGNHDNNSFLEGEESLPANLYTFSDEWKTYSLGDVLISGLELSKENSGSAPVSLVLDAAKFNIVMLHCQVANSKSKNKAETININDYKNKGIDYLALGHIHAFAKESLDARTTYCYPGCLEGRGFDEAGEHGFVVLDIDGETRKYEHTFVPFAYRTIHEIKVDVTDCDDSFDMNKKVAEQTKDIPCDDMVKVILTGEVDVECEKDEDIILSRIKEKYYVMKLDDATKYRIDANDYLLDESLKGEFVRTVMEDDSLDESTRNEVIRYGLMALSGEEIYR